MGKQPGSSRPVKKARPDRRRSLPRKGPPPTAMQCVNAFVCTTDVASCDATAKRVTELGGSIALPKMPVPTVGWLAYGKDTEGNLFGFMQFDPEAK